MHNFKVNLKYNILTRFNLKFFKTMLIFLLVFFIGVNVAAYFLINNSDSSQTVYIYSSNSELSSQIVKSLNEEESNITYQQSNSNDYSVLDLEEEEYLLDLDENKVYSTESSSNSNSTLFNSIFKSIQIANLSVEYGLTAEQIDQINSTGQYEYEYIGEEKTAEESYGVFYVINGIIGVIAFVIIQYGVQFIGTDVVEEKSSRAMEIIITSSKPSTHLLAKVVGILLYTIMLFFMLALIVVITIAGVVIINDFDLSFIWDIMLENIEGISVSKFVLYLIAVLIMLFEALIFSVVVFGVGASIVSSTEEYQKIATPLTFLIMVPYIFTFLPIISDNILKILSYLPIFGVFLAPQNYINGIIGYEQLIINIIVQAVYIVIVTYFGSKIYREGVLNYSDRSIKKVLVDSFRK